MAAERYLAPSRFREAADARDALARALTEAGIQFPAMDVRQAPTHGLVVLGAVSPPVARQLAVAVTRGAAR